MSWVDESHERSQEQRAELRGGTMLHPSIELALTPFRPLPHRCGQQNLEKCEHLRAKYINVEGEDFAQCLDCGALDVVPFDDDDYPAVEYDRGCGCCGFVR